MKRLVIYTAIIGDKYDSLLQPIVKIEDADYICFVKKGSKTNNYEGVWRIEEIDYTNQDNTRVARYAKMHPHILFKDYEYCLWVDGSIQIGDAYKLIQNKIENKVLISSIAHPHVDCCYDDAYICIAQHKDKAWRIIRQILYLKFHKFPKNFGLYETGVMLRNNTSEKVVLFNEVWWDILSRFSRRDQLGCSYAMWKAGLPMDYILPKGISSRNSDVFILHPHTGKKQTTVKEQSPFVKFTHKTLRKLLGYRKNYQ